MIRVNRDLPAIIIANVGTTMRGAVDDIEHIQEILRDLEVADSYIHTDAALSGMILPFVAEPRPLRVRRGHQQHRGQRPQADWGAAALRRHHNPPHQRGTGRTHHRTSGSRTPPCPAPATV